ncbi:uncharacterized protein DS421_16g544950 [Arachis hypogaea]|nr:uncharacterized protein DS421_16g544950 [Arachis hypogaea]
MEGSTHDWMKTIEKQRFRSNKVSPNAYLKFPPMNYISMIILIYILFIFQLSKIITNRVRLTKIYRMTIACFKLTISVGSTLTRVRYYLDDPVHSLVSCTGVVKSVIIISCTIHQPGERSNLGKTLPSASPEQK